MTSVRRLLVPMIVVCSVLIPSVVFAANPSQVLSAEGQGWVGLGAALAIGLAAMGCGIGQGLAAFGALQGIARNPSAAGKIQTPMIIGLALIESLCIYALVIAFFLQGKLPDLG